MEYFTNFHIALKHTNDNAGNKVNGCNDNGHDRIALDDFGCTVHCTIEICFFLNFITANTCFLFCDQSGTHVCVNCHLLTRHCVQGKASCDFRYTFCTFGDNNKLHQNNDEEDEDTNNNIALNYKIAKCLNDLTCFAALRQNQTCRGNIQPQTKQSRNEQE